MSVLNSRFQKIKDHLNHIYYSYIFLLYVIVLKFKVRPHTKFVLGHKTSMCLLSEGMIQLYSFYCGGNELINYVVNVSPSHCGSEHMFKHTNFQLVTLPSSGPSSQMLHYPVAMTVFFALKRCMVPSSMQRAITPRHSPFSISRSKAKYSTK